MAVFPYQKKVLILPYPVDITQVILQNNIRNAVTYEQLVEERYRGVKGKFVGSINDKGFQVSKKVGYWQSFSPQVTGSVEETKSGSLLLLHFSLFFGTKVLFYLFTAITIFVSIMLFKNDDTSTAVLFLGFYLLNYIVTVAAFNMHTKQLYSDFEKLFEEFEQKE